MIKPEILKNAAPPIAHIFRADNWIRATARLTAPGAIVVITIEMTNQNKARIKRWATKLTEKFGEVERGTVWYGSMRSLQFRRLRLPKPLVKRGEYPA